jgi:hypothetical protein
MTSRYAESFIATRNLPLRLHTDYDEAVLARRGPARSVT